MPLFICWAWSKRPTCLWKKSPHWQPNSSLTIRLVSESDAHLTAQELEALDNQLVVTREGNFSALPVTYVRIGDRLARIAPMANYNLQHMSILRFFFSILFFLMALMLLGMAFSGGLPAPLHACAKPRSKWPKETSRCVWLPPAGMSLVA